MLSFRSILFAGAAFATVVSVFPTPDVDSSLVQRTPHLPGLPGLLGLPGPSGPGLPLPYLSPYLAHLA